MKTRPLNEVAEEAYGNDSDWITGIVANGSYKFSLEYLLEIGYPVKALYETIKLCEFGKIRHGAQTWKTKIPKYHRDHYIAHDKDDMKLEEDSYYPSRIHCALREMMYTEAKVFGTFQARKIK